MRKEIYVIDGVTYTRISKATARKLFEDGECVGICPVKLDPSSFWAVCANFKKATSLKIGLLTIS